MKIENHHIFRRNMNCLYRKSSSDTNAINVIDMENASVYYELDGCVADLWRSLDGTISVGDLILLLTEANGLPRKFVAHETKKALNEFIRNKLVEEVR